MDASKAGVRVLGRLLLTATVLAATLSAGAGTRSGNYLIIMAEDYEGTTPMNQFITAKSAQGFNVMTYVPPPGTDRVAIKGYIQSLWGTPDAPDYLLLVGDTVGSAATANTIPHWVGGGSKRATTDLPYACMDAGDDWYPDIYYGRFSVRDTSQLQAIVDKTLFVEAGVFSDPDYVKRVALLASNDLDSGAHTTHDWVIQTYLEPAEYECTRIYGGEGGGTAEVRDAVNRGALFTVYGGHSGSSGWWNPPFDQPDVRSLSNEGLYGLVYGWSCNTAHFDYDECFGETWQRVANKGAAAYLSASTFIYYGGYAWESSRRLEKYFFESFFVDDIWEVSPAWQAACYRLLADPDYGSSDTTRNLIEMNTLLGDPALLLPKPRGFNLIPDPASQLVCSPPDDEAAYSIRVDQLGDYTEPVTLSASGAPAGTTVGFSVNPVTPPGTSLMTVSNIGAAGPGDYDIVVTGTATDMQRSTVVGLGISTGVPGDVTLSSPADGAVDVARSPTLTWLPATQAIEYDLEVATDPSFTSVLYGVTVTETSHTLDLRLDSATEYFWHVQAVNGCGESGFSAPFSFTTLEQADYFTEEFTGAFDLDNFTVSFVPDGSGDFYEMCGGAATEFPTDPAGGTAIVLADDRYEQITLSGSRTVQLYGLGYTSFYVGSNGYITFGAGDSDYSESLAEHFSMPRISLVFDDLNPSSGGTISWKQLEDRAVVTYENVPEYSASGSNSFQVEMFFDGRIRITWLRVDSGDSIAGLSAGEGLPDDFFESDLSAAGPCGPDCPGDFDGDGFRELSDLAILLAHYPTAAGAGYEDGDIDQDGDVDLGDLAGLLAVYGTPCD